MKLRNRGLCCGLLFLAMAQACATMPEDEKEDLSGLHMRPVRVRCPGEKTPRVFEPGAIICASEKLEHPSGVMLRVQYVKQNIESEDPYEHGYYILQMLKKSRVLQTIEFRGEDQPPWNQTPFVRIRKDAYFADLDGDGIDEFAVFPFSSGSALYGTATIYSLTEKIVTWGSGKIHIEGNGHVLLGCPNCWKFDLEACKSCH